MTLTPFEFSARKSLRLNTPDKATTSKKTTDKHLVKSSSSSSGKVNDAKASTSKNTEVKSSSCKDTAPKATSCKQAAPKLATATTSGTQEIVASTPKYPKVLGTITREASPSKPEETARERYIRLIGKKLDPQTLAKRAEKNDNGQVIGKFNVKPKNVANTSTLDLTDNTQNSMDENIYGVAINPEWYQKQGSDYRKMKDVEIARKNKEKADNDPMLKLMKENADNIQKMTESFVNKQPAASVGPICPEQLWADSLVPHLARMTQEVRDQYMVHVLGLAFKAISGRWARERLKWIILIVNTNAIKNVIHPCVKFATFNQKTCHIFLFFIVQSV